ncbi:MAG: class I SAM-dependent methyltransferase [Saccharospirillaceae bacterium]|nr:class I SAM-dependent methyltransferase [Saccharospirillaceae bacterium]MCD8533135.1 class I SAM-dependent methyltransferase [Saccharospirillaceae bacterium]
MTTQSGNTETRPTNNNTASHCPLCQAGGPHPSVKGADKRRYFACGQCSLAFADPQQRLSAADEKAYYATHENSIDDAGYVQFLQHLLTPLLPLLTPGMQALDYGCGPGPTLSKLLAAAGIACDDYDPFFFPARLRRQYDVITATECFEHFHNPHTELSRLSGLLCEGGYLGLMTSRWTDAEYFSRWHYTRDPTHVVFMQEKTPDWIARHFGWEIVWRDSPRVVIFRKPVR